MFSRRICQKQNVYAGKSIEKHESIDIMRGDVRIPFSVQHNVGSVENLDGVTCFRVSITVSQTLQVSLMWCTALLIKTSPFWGLGGHQARRGNY